MGDEPSQNDEEILRLIASLSSVSQPEGNGGLEEDRPDKALEWLLNQALWFFRKCDRLFLLINGEERKPLFVEALRKDVLQRDGPRSTLDSERSRMLNTAYRDQMRIQDSTDYYTLAEAAELVGFFEHNKNADPVAAVLQSYKRYKRVLRDKCVIIYDDADEKFRVRDARAMILPDLPTAAGKPKKRNK